VRSAWAGRNWSGFRSPTPPSVLRRALVEYWHGGTGITSVSLTAAGRVPAEEFDRLRKSLPQRRRQLRHDYLAWLYEEIEENDRHPTYEDYLATAPSDMGERYTPKNPEKVGVG
jgi:hypothetical protein